MCIPPPFLIFMYPVRMPSLMYLIFAKKQRITFFGPPGGRVGWQFFHPNRIRFGKSRSPLFRGLSFLTGFALMAYADLFELFGAYLMLPVSAIFSPTDKMYFICSKGKFRIKFILKLNVSIKFTLKQQRIITKIPHIDIICRHP